MSARTVIATRAQPARMPVMRMPSVCEARSRAKSAAPAREAAGRCRGELSRQSVHDFGELTVLDAAPDQSPGGGLLGGQLLAEERESHGARRADEARQEPGAPGIRNETELRERLHEARRARRDD